jgi:hypothetical protein
MDATKPEDAAASASASAAPASAPLEGDGQAAGGQPLPADPDAYDAPRASQARARGLAAPYIAGGLDPDPEAGRQEDRRYVRLLIAMVVIVVLAGFVLGIIANVLGLPGLLGNP